ncbi:MAG: AMP-dependent synthetase/ligase [Alphaproteobacteria bacterium]
MQRDLNALDAMPNLPTLFFDTAQARKRKPFLWDKVDGKYKSRTYRQTMEEVVNLARGLRDLGIEAGDRVVICSENRPEWAIADIAIMAIGAIAVPAYTTNTTTDHLHILSNSGAKGAIVSTRELASKLMPAAIDSGSCRFIATIEPLLIRQKLPLDVHAYEAIIDHGAGLGDDIVEEARALARQSTACIIYTSGTGGTPKGVELSHGAILCNATGAYDVLSEGWSVGEEVFLSFLPMTHSYEHSAGLWCPIAMGAQIYFAEGAEKLADNLAEARPTVMTAVPRLLEALRARVLRGLRTAPAMRQSLFHRTLDIGKRKINDPASLTFGDKVLDGFLERTVRNQVRNRFGGRLKAFVSGGAALHEEVGMFFEALGVTVLQGYGQTEAAPVISVNRRADRQLHAVGKPMRGVDVQIANDGEIIVRGELLMNGYWNNAAETKKTIVDGWLHTGDIGEFDAIGRIRITDRKKDIIVLSGGDNVSPARVEGFLTLQTEIGQAMVIGDKRPHCAALVVPDAEWLIDFKKETGKEGTLAELADDPDLHKALSAAVSRVNSELSNIEKVRKFAVATAEFTTDNAQMTPSMKVRRHVVKQDYESVLEALYPAEKKKTALVETSAD